MIWLTLPIRAAAYIICMACALAASTWWALASILVIQIAGVYTRSDIAGNRDRALLKFFMTMPAWVIAWICCIVFGSKIIQLCMKVIDWIDRKV